MDKRIIIGADDSGLTLKEAVKEYLIKNGYEVADVMCIRDSSCSLFTWTK